MTALRRISAILLAIGLLIGTVMIIVGSGGVLGWIVYFGLVCLVFIVVSLVIQICLFVMLKNVRSPGFDFLYWFVFAFSLGLIVYFYFVAKASMVLAAVAGTSNDVLGYPLLLLLPFFIQIPLIVCREIRVRRSV